MNTKNWRIRLTDPNDEKGFFFVEADLLKEGHYPRVEVMQEDYGDHNGYDHETRMADAKLIVAAPKLLQTLKDIAEKLDAKEMNVNSFEFELWEMCNDALKQI